MLDNDNSPDSPDSTNTPAGQPAVPPKRVRVSALAKELGSTSKELLALLTELGEGVKTASSTLDQAQADRVRAASTRTAPATESSAPVRAPAKAPAAPESSGPVRAPAKRTRSSARAAKAETSVEATGGGEADTAASRNAGPPPIVFVAPGAEPAAPRRRRGAGAPAGPPPATDAEPASQGPDVTVAEDAEDRVAEPEDVREAAEAEATATARKRRRRGRRGRGGGAGQKAAEDREDESVDEVPEAEPTGGAVVDETAEEPTDDEDAGEGTGATRRRRRRRRTTAASAGEGDSTQDDPPNTVVHVRPPREAKAKDSGNDGDDGVKGVKGSTRLEARRQRRRDGRETTRRRPPILTESEFLARRESVDRVMAVRQSGDRTQIAVLEDDVLVEHYVTRASATSYVGNVYLGRVQNVLPSMEAAFIDIAKGRNGVLYAGEVNWDAAGLEGKSRAIEQALKSGDAVLVQVTKDPIGHKGARLTSQISLPGRFLVYVPGGGMTGISRRLPDTERHRLKSILKKIVPEDAGVIVRTAAEGASEEDLTRDVERLQAEWASIQKKAAKTSNAPLLVHGEPDLAIRVVRDVFNEDFKRLVVQGEDAWQTVSDYIEGVAPDLGERASRYTGDGDLFHDLRVDEQIMKALDRKVWLPSGGSLVIDRTEAMTVIDVNTGKFVGSGGNLEQTVTRNNLEAAEEIVRQLRLRDVGGIMVIDFIDMVLESNRELVLRRLTECLGRDRTKHQVAEVTSLGLVQMTRKRVGEGLLEAFSDTCEVCHGRGVVIHNEPVDKSGSASSPRDDEDGNAQPGKGRRRRAGRHEADEPEPEVDPAVSLEQRTKALAAMSVIHRAAHPNGEPDENTAQLELDAVEAVLSRSDPDGSELDGSELDGIAPAAEVIAATQPPETVVADTSDAFAPQPATETETEPESAHAADVAPKAARPRRRRTASRPAGPPVSA